MARLIHHTTYEVDKKLIAGELRFWACLGFTPTGLRRRTRKQPPIHWLVSGDETHAVELLPVDTPALWGLGHIALVLDQGRWHIATELIDKFGWHVDKSAQPYHGNIRYFVTSPTGHKVEIMSGSPSIKAGPPLTESGE